MKHRWDFTVFPGRGCRKGAARPLPMCRVRGTRRLRFLAPPPPPPAAPWRSRPRQPRSSVCSDCAQLFPMMSVDWGMCSLVVAPRAGFGRVRFRVEQARRPCATPSSGRSRVHDADPTYRAGFSRRSTPPHALRALRPAPCTATPCPLRLRTLSCTCSSF